MSLIHVGKVSREFRRVCACCSLDLKFCRCTHSQEHFDTNCDRRTSTY